MPPRRPKRGLAVWLTSTSLPVFVLDERRVMLMFNRGCEELTGWSAGEVIGRVCDFVIEGEPGRVESLTGLLAPPPQVYLGETIHSRLPLTLKSGDICDCVLQFFPLGQVAGDDRFRILGIITEAPAATLLSAPPQASWHTKLAGAIAESQRRYGVPLVANSAPMRRVAAQVKLAQETRAAVHFCGAAGTGKEFLARRIHATGTHRTQAFVPLDCRLSVGELTRLLERVLTIPDADSRPGAICLRHVERLPRELQVLVRQVYMAPGAPRLFSTSEQSLTEKLDTGDLDAGFYHLLTTLVIELPTLESRPQDIPLLAQQVLERFNMQQAKQVTGFAPAVRDLFCSYYWPGNIAELESVIYAAWCACTETEVTAQHLPVDFLASQQADDLPPVPTFPSLESHLEEAERQLLSRALAAAQGNKTLVAEWLKIPRAKLYRRLEALQLIVAGETVLLDSGVEP